MQTWHTKIQRRTGTYVKLTALCVCIVSMVGIGLKAIFSKSKSTEEVKPPKDYAEPRWTDSDWANWIIENKDDWN